MLGHGKESSSWRQLENAAISIANTLVQSLVTHDPVHYVHMAYLPFPSTWPTFTAKDKLGNWLESYASVMELNVWTGTTITNAAYNDSSKTWTVDLQREGEGKRTLSPKHIILCTGHPRKPMIPAFPGQDKFKGQIYHASQHRDTSLSGIVKGQTVLVVGTGVSGHDIVQNFYENDASVTMLQRGGTYVLTTEKGLRMMHRGMYEEGGPPIEDVDIIAQSLPNPIQFALSVGFTQLVKEAEKETLEGLEKAGFEIDFGVDGSGALRKYLTTGGGYYPDVGCSQLIIDRKIKVMRSPDGIKQFGETGVVLADGRKVEADLVVLAMGYENMKTSVEKILGEKAAERCKKVKDLDEEGEFNAVCADPLVPNLPD